MYYICKFKVFTNMATMRIFEVISDKESVIIQNVRLSGTSLIRRKKNCDKAIGRERENHATGKAGFIDFCLELLPLSCGNLECKLEF